MYRFYQNQACAAYSSHYFIIYFLSNYQTLKIFVTFFSETEKSRRLKLGSHVDIGQMYRVYRNQSLLICPFNSSFFFLSNFQTLKFFVTLFSRTVRPRKLKLCTHMDSGQMYHVYRNQAAANWSPYFFIFFFSNFQTLKFFARFYQEL